MKKLAITLVVALAALSLASCAGSAEDFIVSLTSYNEEIDSYEEALYEFKDEIKYEYSTEGIEKLCSDMAAKSQDTMNSASAYLDEIKGYEKGIKNEELFQSTVEKMESYSAEIQSSIDNIPTIKDFYLSSVEYRTTMDEWTKDEFDFEDAIESLDDLDDFQELYDEMVELDEETISAINSYIETIDKYEAKLNDENSFNKLKEEMSASLLKVQKDLDSLSELKRYIELAKEFETLSTEYSEEYPEKLSEVTEANSQKEYMRILNELLTLNKNYSKQLLAIAESLEEIKSETYKNEINVTIDSIDELTGLINDSIDQLENILGK
ncbi:MAG: hypothetical protein AB1Z23_09950 [Eubacteriales bacterium]